MAKSTAGQRDRFGRSRAVVRRTADRRRRLQSSGRGRPLDRAELSGFAGQSASASRNSPNCCATRICSTRTGSCSTACSPRRPTIRRPISRSARRRSRSSPTMTAPSAARSAPPRCRAPIVLDPMLRAVADIPWDYAAGHARDGARRAARACRRSTIPRACRSPRRC